jgi:transposase
VAKLYVGLDLGSRHIEQVVMRLHGKVVKRKRFATSEINLREAFADLKGEVHVHMEAGELAPWVREVIKPYTKSITISHARDNAWIAKDPNKGDRIDAFKLADLLRMNRVTPVYYAEDPARRDFKLLVQHYDDLTAQEVALKAMIKSRLRTQGVIVHSAAPFTEQGCKQVLARVSSAPIRNAIRQLYKVLVHTLEVRDQALRAMVKAGRRFPEIKLFQDGVPGIGPIGACRFSAYVQTPHRFSNKRKLWRYCRLGISYRSSDGKLLAHPKLDRAGCGVLKDVARTAFRAAMASKDDNQFKRAYEQALERTHNETHARLTVMRKIVSVLRAMWLTNSQYKDVWANGA